MILVDSSVWIDFIRGFDTEATRKLGEPKCLEQVVVGDLVILEVLQGARSARHALGLEEMLRAFPVVNLLDDALATWGARNFRTLREHGFTMRRTTDLIIGTFCIAHDHALLHADRDFEPMARHLGLRIA